MTPGKRAVKSGLSAEEEQRLILIDSGREKVAGARLDGAQKYNHSHVEWTDFPGWHRASSGVRDPDRARQVLYFGFQPVYDLLISDIRDPKVRISALSLMDGLNQAGIEYLTGYYTGQTDVDKFRESVQKLEPHIPDLERSPYRIKFRNVDHIGITPQGIQSFLRQFLERSLYYGALPDYVVGCACGSSEIVMPLAGILGVELGFIRRSWRRGDDAPKVVREHEPRIQEAVRGKDALCVEDYVCTGESLKKVMRRVRGYGAASVTGASVNGETPSASGLKVDLKRKKLQLYSFTD